MYFYGMETHILPYISRSEKFIILPLRKHLLIVQFSSVAQSCPTLCDPMNHSTPGLPVHHQLSEFTQTHIHRVGDAIQPSLPLSPPFPPAPNHSHHQSLFQWVNSSHEVANDNRANNYTQKSEKVKALVAQLCPTLCDSMDRSLTGFSMEFYWHEYWIG